MVWRAGRGVGVPELGLEQLCIAIRWFTSYLSYKYLAYLSPWRVETACICNNGGVVTTQLSIRAERRPARRRSVGRAKQCGHENDNFDRVEHAVGIWMI